MGDENGEDSSVMRIGKRCYVGNLAWKTSWQDLKDKFRDVGNVVYANVMRDDGGEPQVLRLVQGWILSAVVCKNQLVSLLATVTGRSKGWGIVEFETPEEVNFICLLKCSCSFFSCAKRVQHNSIICSDVQRHLCRQSQL